MLLFSCQVMTPCKPMDCSILGFPFPHHLQEFAQVHVHWIGDDIQPSHPLSPLFLPSIFAHIKVFSSESAVCINWLKNWSFSISPSNKYSGLISFKIDWFWSLCCPKDPQESFPTPQFKSINSSTFCFLYGPALTSIHHYWKDHSLDYMAFCQQSDILLTHCLVGLLELSCQEAII